MDFRKFCGDHVKLIIIIFIIIYIILVASLGDSTETSSVFEHQTIMDQHGYYFTNFDKSQFDSNVSDNDLKNYNRFWAPNDYVYEPDEEVFEIYTNFAISNVTRKTCAEDPQYDVGCDLITKVPCEDGKQSPNGIQTGNCVAIEIPEKYVPDKKRWHTCEVKAWCPTAVWPPLKHDYGAILGQTENTSLLIQSYIQFLDKQVKFQSSTSDIPNCHYDKYENKHCPYFRLGDIIKYASDNTKTYQEIARDTGGIFEIKINWDCELGSNCVPEFTFSRKDSENDLSPSLYSFWKFDKLDPDQRVMTYGMKIKFYVITEGKIKRKIFWNKFFFNFSAWFAYFILIILIIFFIIPKKEGRYGTIQEERDGQQYYGQQRDGQERNGQQRDGQERNGQECDAQERNGQERDRQERDRQERDGEQQPLIRNQEPQ